MASIRFLGAAGNVTGSRFLVETDASRVLVDCGLYQEREFASRNWQPLAVDPRSIDAVVLTHAHLDHSGYLPRLVHDGFRGRIYCTAATAEITELLLVDAGHINEEDAAYKRRRHEREGRRGPYPELPLYTARQARHVTTHFTHVPYDKRVRVTRDVSAELLNAGHILGSAIVRLTFEGGSIAFSGDLGRPGQPVLPDPAPPPDADALVIESTYGDRVHPRGDVEEEFARIINQAVERGGNVVIPSFAVERAQDVLYALGRLVRDGRVPALTTFVDSPMATSVTELFDRYASLLAPGLAAAFRRGESPLEFPGLSFVRSVDQSKAINQIASGAVIIAGAGMCNGGRVKHHLVTNIGRPESTILFVGYQARGTLGRHIVQGESPVRILGKQYEVRARIAQLHEFSAHADRDELLGWVRSAAAAPTRMFVVHGEEEASRALAAALREQGVTQVVEPAYGDLVELR
jgi:metallo-beta-lactamase family protein